MTSEVEFEITVISCNGYRVMKQPSRITHSEQYKDIIQGYKININTAKYIEIQKKTID